MGLYKQSVHEDRVGTGLVAGAPRGDAGGACRPARLPRAVTIVRRTLGRSLRRYIAACSAIACALLIAGCDTREERAAAAAMQADQFLQAGDMVAARIHIQDALKERDDVAAYWLLLARAEVATERYGSAYGAYLRVLELDKSNQEALHAVAELSLASGQLDEAAKYADQLLAFNTQNQRAMLVQGTVALRRDKLDDAMRLADQVLALDPANDAGALLKAQVLGAQKKPAEGAAILEAAMKARGDKPALLSGLLDLYRQMRDGAGIERTFGRQFTLTPRNADLQIDYARELFLNGNSRDGLATTRRVQQAHPDDAKIQGRIVDLWLEAGPGVVGDAELVRIADGGGVAQRVALARYALEDGRPAQAETLLRPIIGQEMTAATLEPHILYAMAEQALGRRGAAYARADKVLGFDATNPRALLLRAQIAMARADFDRALADAQVIARDNPDLAAERGLLGQIYALRKENGLAEAAFQRAMQDYPDSAAVVANYVNFLVGANQRPRALRVAEAFTTRDPELVAGWEMRGSLCITVGDDACAAIALKTLPALRGGRVAAQRLQGALAASQRQRAALPDDVRPIALAVQQGRADPAAAIARLIEDRRAADAERLVRFILGREPQNSLAAVLLGDVLIARGDVVAGERQLRATIVKFPAQARAYASLARLRLRQGDRAGAFAVLDQGLDRLRSNPVLLQSLAMMQERTGDPMKAIATYRSLVRESPDNLVAVNNLAALLIDHGPRPEALGEAELLARRLQPVDAPAFLDTRGWLALQRGDKATALRLLRQATAAQDAPAIAHYHLAETLAATGDRAAAAAAARRALAAVDPVDRWAGAARALASRP